MDAHEYARAVAVGLQVDHGFTQLDAYRALRRPSAEYLLRSGLPASDVADSIARICDRRHSTPAR